MAAIKSIQNGTVTIGSTATSATAAITAVDLTKTVLFFSIRKSADRRPDDDFIRGYFSSTTQLTFDRIVGARTATVEWYAVEWTSGVTVQSGTHTDVEDTTITAVVLANSFVWNTYKTDGGTIGKNKGIKSWLSSMTNLRMYDNDATLGGVDAAWFVIESTDFTVQTGLLAMSSGTTADATITAVTLAKAFPILSWSINATADAKDFLLRGHFTSTTVLRAQRNFDGADPGTDGIRWQVVEVTDGSTVQSGTFSFADADGQESATVTAVTNGSPIASGFMGRGGESAKGSGAPSYAEATLDLTTSTNLQADRAATSKIADVEWFLIDWNAGGIVLTETVNEAVSVMDSTSSVKTIKVTISDSIGVTDGVATAKSVVAAISEPLGVTDSATPVKAATQAIPDDVGVIDSTTRIHTAKRTPTDDVGATDLVATSKSIFVTISDSVGVIDLVEPTLQIIQSIVDPIGVTDSTTRVASAVRVITEAVAVMDVVSDSETNREQVVETVGVTDLIARVHSTKRTPTDDIGVTDQIAPAKTIQVEITDAVGVVDSTVTAKTAVQAISDGVEVTDSVAAAKSIFITITDNVGVTDLVVDDLTTLGLFETVTDDIDVTDTTTRVHDAVRSQVESVGVTDQVVGAKNITVTISDSVGVIDSAVPGKMAATVIVDGVEVTDSTLRAHTARRTSTEAVGVLDTVARVVTYVRELTELVGVVDTTTALIGELPAFTIAEVVLDPSLRNTLVDASKRGILVDPYIQDLLLDTSKRGVIVNNHHRDVRTDQQK